MSSGSLSSDNGVSLDNLLTPVSARAPKHLTLGVARSFRELEEIRDTWTSLQRHPNADIDFYLTVCSGPAFVRPHIIIVYGDGQPIALVIGRIERRTIDCKIGYTSVFRPGSCVMNFIHEGLLGDISLSTSRMLVQEIKRSLDSGEADIAVFNYLRIDSPVYQELLNSQSSSKRDDSVNAQTHRTYALPCSLDEFRLVLSRRTKKNRWNKLTEDHGDLRICCFRKPSDLNRIMEDVEIVAVKTYQRGIGVGFVDDLATRERLQLQAEKGWLRVHILYLGGRPVAFWICNHYQSVYHSDCMGYDPSLSKYSPGMFLVMKTIEEICAGEGSETIREIDWGLGDAEYKKALGTHEWQEAQVRIFASTLKGIKLRLMVNSTRFAELFARRMLERTGLVKTIKKVWRRQARTY